MENKLPRPLRLGVIGAGGIAQSSHLPALVMLRQGGWPVEVVALADPDEKRIAEALRRLVAGQAADEKTCRVYDNGAALFASGGVDTVLILTTPAHTPALLEDALVRGIPALAEKPGASHTETFAQLMQVEKTAQSPCVRIAYNRHSLPHVPAFLTYVDAMKRQTPAGVLHAEARLWRVARDNSIFYDDTMVHALDFLRWSMGPLAVQRVDWSSPSKTTGDLPSGLHVTFQTKSGDGDGAPAATAHLDVRPAVGREIETYEMMGDRQVVTLTYPPINAPEQADLILYHNGMRQAVPFPNGNVSAGESDPVGLLVRGFVPQLAAFLRLAAGDIEAGKHLCTLSQAHATTLLKEAILCTA